MALERPFGAVISIPCSDGYGFDDVLGPVYCAALNIRMSFINFDPISQYKILNNVTINNIKINLN